MKVVVLQLVALVAALTVVGGVLGSPLRQCVPGTTGKAAAVVAPHRDIDAKFSGRFPLAAGRLTGFLAGPAVTFAAALDSATPAWGVRLSLQTRQARLSPGHGASDAPFKCALGGSNGDARLMSHVFTYATVAPDVAKVSVVAEQWLETAKQVGALEHSLKLLTGPSAPGTTFSLTFDVTTSQAVASSSVDADTGAFIVRSAADAVLLELSAPVAFDADGTPLAARFVGSDDGATLAYEVTLPATGSVAYPLFIDPFASTPSWQITGTQHRESFGYSLAMGDLNADGEMDLAIGSPAYDTRRGLDAGRVTLVMGTSNSFETVADGHLELPSSYSHWDAVIRASFGVSLDIGDADGDAYMDLVVGAPQAGGSNDNGYRGEAFLYRDDHCSTSCKASCVDSTVVDTVISSPVSYPGWGVRLDTGIPQSLGTVSGVYRETISETTSVETRVETLISESIAVTSIGIPSSGCHWHVGQFIRFDDVTFGSGFLWHTEVGAGWPTSTLTFELFYRGTDTVGSLAHYASSSHSDAFRLYDPNALRARFRGTNLNTGANVADGMWHHIAVTWRTASSGQTIVYVDGAQVASGTTTTGSLGGVGSFLVAGRLNNGYRYRYTSASNSLEDSEISLVRMWNEFRSATQIADSIGCAPAPSPTLYASWDFSVVERVNDASDALRVRDPVSGHWLGIVNGEVSAPDSTLPRPSTGSVYTATLERTINTTTITHTRTCSACSGAGGCRWRNAQENPMSDRLGWNNAGQIGSAVAIGATLTGSGGVAVGRHLLGSPYGGEGYVYIYNNPRSNFGTTVDDTRLQNPQSSRRGAEGFGMFGNRLYARADLLNGDGRVDLVVAAPRHSDTQQSGGIGYTGRVLVYPGTTGTTMSTTPGWAVTGPSFNSGFGRGLAAADVNGDGFMDLLVGAPFRQVNAGNDGAVYVYAGSASGLSSTTAAQMVAGPAIYGQFGEAIAPAGDLNRDGCPDVVIGAPNTGDNVEGAVYVFRGCDSVTGFLGATPAQAITMPEENGMFGRAMVSAVDIDGDSWNDLIVSHPFWYASGMATQAVGRVIMLRGLPMADLEVTSVVAPVASVAVPAQVTVTASFRNNGASVANNGVATFEFEAAEGLSLNAPSGALLAGACTLAPKSGAPTFMVSTCPLNAIPVSPTPSTITYTFSTTVDTPNVARTVTFSVVADEVDEDGATGSDSFSLTAPVDISVQIVSEPPEANSVILDGFIEYVVVVRAAPAMVTAYNVQLSSNMPTSAFFYDSVVAQDTSPTHTVACGGASTCTIPRLRSGEEFNVTYTLQVLDGITSLVTNNQYVQTFTVTTDSDDSNSANDVAVTKAYNVTQTCDLVVNLIASPTSVVAGSEGLNLVATFQNIGRVVCAGVEANLTVPTGIQYLLSAPQPSSFSPACVWDQANYVVSCKFDAPRFEARSVFYRFKTMSSSDAPIPVLMNTTQTTLELEENLHDNNAAVVVNSYFAVDAGVSLQPPSRLLDGNNRPLYMIPEVPVRWSIGLKAGSSASDIPAGATTVFHIPAVYGVPPTGLTAQSANGVTCVVSGAAANVTCTWPQILAGGEMSIDVLVEAPFTAADTIRAQVAVTNTGIPDFDTSNNVVFGSELLDKTTNVALATSYGPVPSPRGGTMEIRGDVVVNGGRNPAKDLVLNVEYPEDVTYVSAVLLEGSCVDKPAVRVVTCTLRAELVDRGRLVPTLLFTPTFLGTRVFNVNITNSRTEQLLSDNVKAVSVTTVNQVNVAASLDIIPTRPVGIAPGTSFTYTTRMNNIGFSASPTATAVFKAPDESSITGVAVVASNTTCVQSGATVTCTRLDPLPGGTTTNVVIANIDVAFPDNLNVTRPVSTDTGPSSRGVLPVGHEYVPLKASLTVSSPILDSNMANNYAELSINATFRESDIGFVSSTGAKGESAKFAFQGGQPPFRTGEAVGILLRVHSFGPLPAEEVTFAVQLPGTGALSNVAVDLTSADAALTSCTIDQSDAERSLVTCFISSLGIGRAQSLVFTGVASGGNSTGEATVQLTGSKYPDVDVSDNAGSLAIQFRESITDVPNTGQQATPVEKQSSGLGWLLYVIIALAVALLIFCILAALGFFKRKKPPTESELEAEKAAAEMEMDGIDSDEILDVDGADNQVAVAEL